MGVCEALKRLPELDGRVVAIHGQLQGGSMLSGGAYFDQLVEPHCALQGDSRGVIRLESPDQHFLAHPPRGYRADKASIKRVAQILAREKDKGAASVRLDVVVEGVLYQVSPGSPTTRHARGVLAVIVVQAYREPKLLE